MLRSDAPRPTFLVTSVLRATGVGRPDERSYPNLGGTLETVVPGSKYAEEWGVVFEPLIVVLTLAGYDCPEIAIGHWDAEQDKSSCWRCAAASRTRPATRSRAPETGARSFRRRRRGTSRSRCESKRVAGSSNRWVGRRPIRPCRWPACSTATWRDPPRPRRRNSVRDRADGWIHGSQVYSGPGAVFSTRGFAKEARDAVAAGLAAAWRASGARPSASSPRSTRTRGTRH